jgi:hypothetical protein
MMQAETTLADLAFQAEGGDAGAQYRLGVLFLLGESVEQDLQGAHRWLTRAAERQYPGALALTEKLAHCGQLESERAKRSNRFAGLARARVRSGSTAALRFCRDSVQSIRVSFERVLSRRVWKLQAQNLVARVRFRSKASELPTRRREGFQFRDSL